MALNIRNDQVEELAVELAALTGDTKTAAVGKALAAQLERLRKDAGGQSMVDEVAAIARHCSSLPVLDDRTADEILGYDDAGLPS